MGNPNQLLATAKTHFKDRLLSAELESLEVPEWDVTLYIPITVSMGRRDKVVRASQGGGISHLIDVILECAKDEEGKPYFQSSKSDYYKKEFMTHVDPDVITRVAGEISKALVPSEMLDEGSVYEEAVKNSEKTTSLQQSSVSQTEET